MSCEPAFDYHRATARWEYTGKVYEEATATCRSALGEQPTLRLTTNLGSASRAARPAPAPGCWRATTSSSP